MSTITKEQAKKIIEAADEVITALSGTNEDVHPDNSTKMVRLYDDLNDYYAPPEVVRELARIALASLEAEKCAEPVAFINGAWTLVYYRPPKELGLKIGDKLYAAPPAQVSVLDAATAIRACMEEFPESVYDIVEECAAIAESACRAAMLQGGK